MSNEKQIHTEVVDIDDLIQDDHNFNKGTEEGAELIGRSFKEHGAGRSVFIDKNNRLVGGNKAQKGFKGAGYRKVVIIDSDPDTLVAVRRKDVDLDTREGREMALLDNLTTERNLQWDPDELKAVETEVPDFDAAEYGWEPPQLDDGTKNQTNTEAEKAQEDDFDENTDPVEHRVKLGDIWQLGKHRLMCGDSCDIEQVKKLCGGQQVDCWLTDPPYNVALGYEGSASEAKQRHRRTDQKIVLNDSMPDEKFREFLCNAYTAARENMKEGAAYYIFHADNESYNFRGALRDVGGMQLRQTLIWVKDTITLGRQDYQWKHEPCLYGWKEGAAHKWFNDRKQSTCIEFPRPKRSEEHPTMKPVPLFAYLMANSTQEGDIVLDSFGGSGTTLIAAEQLNRSARLMELSEVYCDVIIARWEKLTGQKAVKLNP